MVKELTSSYAVIGCAVLQGFTNNILKSPQVLCTPDDALEERNIFNFFFLIQILSQFVKQPIDTLHCYFNIFHHTIISKIHLKSLL
jgi:hypothetical protein